MAIVKQEEYKIELLTPEQRVQEDPRGLERMTRIGETVFRKLLNPQPEVTVAEEVNNG